MSQPQERALSRIRALAQSVTESEENANDLVDLLEYLQAEDVEVLKAAIREVTQVCCQIVTENYSWLRPVGTRGRPQGPSKRVKKSSDITVQYHDWMRKNYVACLERLLQLLYHEDSEVQVFSLCSLLKLVEAEGSAHYSTHHTYAFPNAFFHRVVSCLLDNDIDMRHLIGQFQEYLEFDDVRFYWLKNIVSVVLARIDKQARQVRIGPNFVENVYCALEQVQMPTSDQEIGQFLAGEPPSSDDWKGAELEREDVNDGLGEEDESLGPPKSKKMKKGEMKAQSVKYLNKHRKHFSDAWLSFLRLPLPSAVYKKVLVSLHAAVMPHLLNPPLLIDFLTDAYDAGGVISLLALNGLFILMHEYHLDYPAFYTKLYALLEPSIFHVKYMQRFFCLMDTFLSSSHLPLYLVAAFAKKIARLALTAPPNGVMVAAVLVINLVKRHPNCRVLLHRKGAEDVEIDNDPFSLTETDPAKCGALESCLWELKTLRSHYCPAVSTLLTCLLNPSEEKRREEVLGKYLDMDYQQLFKDELKSTELRNEEKVPMNFIEPAGLWTPEELKVFRASTVHV